MARLLDGTGADFLQVDLSPVTAAPFYVSVWGRTDDLAAEGCPFRLARSSGAGIPRWLMRHEDMTLLWKAGGDEANTTIDLTLNKYQHYLGAEASSTDRRVYLDGGNKGTNATLNVPTLIDRTTIGRNPNGAFWSGDIAHIAVYSGIPTDDDALTLANGINPQKFNPDNLVAYWPLGGQSGEPDIVGGLTLVVFGSPTVSEEPPIPHCIVAPG